MLQLSPLPYAYDALEPHLDEATMRLHHDKHHQAYIDKANAALAKYPDLAEREPLELLRQPDTLPADVRSVLSNNLGGDLNHNFFWRILRPADGTTKPAAGSALLTALATTFGSFEDFKTKFSEQALAVFGSGWCWLAWDSGEQKLVIVTTANQAILPPQQTALLAADVWEHAYYLKYQNRRLDYLAALFHVFNWAEAERIFTAAQG